MKKGYKIGTDVNGFTLDVTIDPTDSSRVLVSIVGKPIGFMMRAFDGQGADPSGSFVEASLPVNTMLNQACINEATSVSHAENGPKRDDDDEDDNRRRARRRLLDDLLTTC